MLQTLFLGKRIFFYNFLPNSVSYNAENARDLQDRLQFQCVQHETMECAAVCKNQLDHLIPTLSVITLCPMRKIPTPICSKVSNTYTTPYVLLGYMRTVTCIIITLKTIRQIVWCMFLTIAAQSYQPEFR